MFEAVVPVDITIEVVTGRIAPEEHKKTTEVPSESMSVTLPAVPTYKASRRGENSVESDGVTVTAVNAVLVFIVFPLAILIPLS